MMTRTTKAAFYRLCGPLMRANGWFYRVFRAPSHGMVRVQLGPGQGSYQPEWINVDANMFTARCDVWTDFSKRLPFRDGTVDVLYSHHVIEHLPDLRLHCREIFRCLKPGGVFRICGPNGDSAIKKYLEGDAAWFGDFPDKRRSLGGRFENFIFCRQEHLTILTFSYLEELFQDAGFKQILRCLPKTQTHFPELIDEAVLGKEWEACPECPHTLVIEGVKPHEK
jgi:predicted SAM-dependent methyltransferase